MAMKRENEKLPGIEERYRLLTFEYAFRQVGFIVLLGIIVAAIAGLFSSGIVSDTVKTNSAKSLGRDADLVVMVDCQIPSDDLIVHFF